MDRLRYIVLSDLDGTLTEAPSSWQFIMETFNKWESEGKFHLDSFLNKKIDYDEFIRLDVNSWKGIPSKQYLDAINKIKFRDGVRELFNFFSSSKAKIYIISSGLMDLAIRAKYQFPIDEIYANEISIENGVLNGKYKKNVGWNDNRSKDNIVKEILKEHPRKTPIIALGDTISDYPLLSISNLSFSCYSSNVELNKIATYVINDKEDFTSIPIKVEKFLKAL